MSYPVSSEIRWAAEKLSGAGIESPLLEAQLLMAHCLGWERLTVIAHPEYCPSELEQHSFRDYIEKRAGHYPLAYILGHRQFYDVDLIVEPGVLIPRQETELLVEECIARVASVPSPVIADIGVGSGAIAVALALNIADAKVYATEISEDAIRVAKANIAKYELDDRIELLVGDLATPVAVERIVCDAIVSNPPYIPSTDIEALDAQVRLYEPMLALDGGQDGLNAYRRLFPECIGAIKAGGFLAVEIGINEAEGVKQIAESVGYRDIEVIKDLAGIERVVVAYK